LGEDLSLDEGVAASRACGLMILAQLKAALGSLGRVERVVKLGVFVNSSGEFTDQPKVANGASELMVAAFGDAGRHARSAVGVPVLPLGAAVEVDAIVAVRPD
jgi:enamine deaminase RidA (YjgF/YER057c/UK114 family)